MPHGTICTQKPLFHEKNLNLFGNIVGDQKKVIQNENRTSYVT
jgi:hypothetical protein